MKIREPFAWTLVVCLLLWIAYSCESGKRKDLEAEIEKSNWQQNLNVKTAEILTRDSLIRDLQRSAIERRGKDSIALNRKERANSALARKLAEKRVDIQPAIDSLGPIRDYVLLSDSLLASKDTLIHEMRLRHSAQVVELNEIIDLHAKQALSKDAVIELMEKRNADLEKTVKKVKRGNKGLKVLLGIAVAWGVYESVKN